MLTASRGFVQKEKPSLHSILVKGRPQRTKGQEKKSAIQLNPDRRAMKSIYEEDTRIWCLVGIVVLNTCLYVDEKQCFADFKLALPRI